MIPPPNIILTGFMGTGKSTIGRLLAAQLNREFIDTDKLIEEKTGRSIPEIFAQDGEAAFREHERQVARELAGRSDLVIATGGRLMLDPENAIALGKNGSVFCLVAAPEEIFERVSHDEAAADRPLLSDGDPLERIKALLAERSDGYGRFPQVATSGRSPSEIVREIVDALMDA